MSGTYGTSAEDYCRPSGTRGCSPTLPRGSLRSPLAIDFRPSGTVCRRPRELMPIRYGAGETPAIPGRRPKAVLGGIVDPFSDKEHLEDRDQADPRMKLEQKVYVIIEP